VEFEWDESKRQQVREKHGIDILYAALIFENHVLTKPDNRADYGEERLISLGIVDDECFVVVHTQRNGSMRLITAWKGGRIEYDQYQAGLARRRQEDGGGR
jgi:uncharacterized DUF497 family protein